MIKKRFCGGVKLKLNKLNKNITNSNILMWSKTSVNFYIILFKNYCNHKYKLYRNYKIKQKLNIKDNKINDKEAIFRRCRS